MRMGREALMGSWGTLFSWIPCCISMACSCGGSCDSTSGDSMGGLKFIPLGGMEARLNFRGLIVMSFD